MRCVCPPAAGQPPPVSAVTPKRWPMAGVGCHEHVSVQRNSDHGYMAPSLCCCFCSSRSANHETARIANGKASSSSVCLASVTPPPGVYCPPPAVAPAVEPVLEPVVVEPVVEPAVEPVVEPVVVEPVAPSTSSCTVACCRVVSRCNRCSPECGSTCEEQLQLQLKLQLLLQVLLELQL